MKKTIILSLLLACVCWVANAHNGSNQVGAGGSKEITKTFKKYGFSITAPCVLEDLTSHGLGNDAYFVGTVNPNDPQNATVYQVVVKKVPKSIDECSEVEINDMMDQIKKSGFTNVERLSFSDHKYPGFIGNKRQDGETVRAVMFSKDKYFIVLSVVSNSDLNQKFNQFTNSFKVID